jgi:hypothetical protein
VVKFGCEVNQGGKYLPCESGTICFGIRRERGTAQRDNLAPESERKVFTDVFGLRKCQMINQSRLQTTIGDSQKMCIHMMYEKFGSSLDYQARAAIEIHEHSQQHERDSGTQVATNRDHCGRLAYKLKKLSDCSRAMSLSAEQDKKGSLLGRTL